MAEIALFDERIEEGENGIDGGVVVILVGGVIDHADVGRRAPYSAADTEEKQCADEQQTEEMQGALHRMRRGKTRTARAVTIGTWADAPKHPDVTPDEEQKTGNGEQKVAPTETIGDAGGVVEIRKADGVEFEAPFFI